MRLDFIEPVPVILRLLYIGVIVALGAALLSLLLGVPALWQFKQLEQAQVGYIKHNQQVWQALMHRDNVADAPDIVIIQKQLTHYNQWVRQYRWWRGWCRGWFCQENSALVWQRFDWHKRKAGADLTLQLLTKDMLTVKQFVAWLSHSRLVSHVQITKLSPLPNQQGWLVWLFIRVRLR